MYKLFIADDEPWILEGIMASIDWKQEGFRLAGTALNGPDAICVIRETRPHLALVDIRMPGCNGLEVISRARVVSPATRFVIVSGFAEFEYAREAIELSVAGYLLKPIDEMRLLELVRSVRQSLDAKDSTPGKTSPILFIQNHYCEEFSFGELCRRFAKSPTAMRQLIQKETGETFTQYITTLRMNQAADLLTETELSVNEIATICGYTDALYFRKVFKKYHGVTPSEYRVRKV